MIDLLVGATVASNSVRSAPLDDETLEASDSAFDGPDPRVEIPSPAEAGIELLPEWVISRVARQRTLFDLERSSP